MASPKRDKMQPAGGKMLKDDDSILDVSALLAKIDSITSAVSGLLVNATITTGDIEIGAVELKNAADDQRASIEAANVARTAATKVLAVQTVDEAGLVLGRDAANTARTTATKVNPTQNVDPAGTVAANITAGADAVSNTATRLGVSSWLKAFNGTTWDRVRSGITTIGSTFTGFLNTLPWAIYNASPTVRTEGQGGPLQANARGALNVTLETRLNGEDPNADVMKVEQQYVYTNITTQTTTTVKSGSGMLHAIVLNTPVASAVVTIYDNTAGSGTLIGTITLPGTLLSSGPVTVMINGKFNTGCTIVTSGATMNITALTR